MATPQDIRRVIDQQCHRVYTLAYYTLGSHQDAEDATQEVLTRFWRHAGRVDPERVEGWLVRVTTNVCRDQMRKRSSRREDVATEATEHALTALPSGEPGPPACAESVEAIAEIERELGGLNEPFRSLLILREVQGLSYQAIAAAMEMPLSQVRVYLHRGRRRLAKRLGPAAGPKPVSKTNSPVCSHEA
ncbi:ECF RNA polymerase sigma factor SigE [Planctomycetes bacterium MalM25]|nr:ECF RNA polymerase sigma factor SigE [Planctomycetes bacterium MalM25]